MAVAALLSLVMPGLGHVYIGRFGRALIWFGGALLIFAILSSEDTATWVSLVMLSVLAVFAAFDAGVLIRAASGGPGRT
ncbi:MAG: hypothetical protein MUE51_11225 [Thermoleophilia bacterium]|jgi:TM2 domain-containing membrane protein YozV|nr:hypothetical protein [Thermoleophilia bacterium]